MKQFVTREHETEPVPGLPGKPPAGEKILWQGRPSARLVARHGLRSLWIGGYFLLLGIWAGASGFADGQPVGGIVFSIAILAALAAVVLGLIEFYAWAVERTTLYTITTERVVMRFGVALSMSLNLPFKQVGGIALAKLGNRGGTVAVALKPGHRLSWLVQWPHVRGWRFSAPEPSLICLADAESVAALLAYAYGQNARAGAGVSVETDDGTDIQAAPHAAAAE